MQAAVKAADAAAAAGQVREVTLAWDHTDKSHPIDFRGYAYTLRALGHLRRERGCATTTRSRRCGRCRSSTRCGPSSPSPLPKGGYLVPAAHAAWVEAEAARPRPALRGWRRAVPARRGGGVPRHRGEVHAPVLRGPPEPHRQGRVEAGDAGAPGGLALRAGGAAGRRAARPPARARRARTRSLAWGFFNAHFEQKEYIEDYVLEPFARELLAKDAAREGRLGGSAEGSGLRGGSRAPACASSTSATPPTTSA